MDTAEGPNRSERPMPPQPEHPAQPDLDPEVVERAAKAIRLQVVGHGAPTEKDRNLARAALLASGLPEQVEDLRRRVEENDRAARFLAEAAVAKYREGADA